jgi:hypothetical protein
MWSGNKEKIVQNCMLIENKAHYGKLRMGKSGWLF